jgi:small ubiquitin-related modifier
MSSTARVVVKDSKTAVAHVFITLKVVDQTQNRFRHTMRRTAKLQVLMDAWYREVPDVVYGTGTFWLEEICLFGKRTPADLKMQDGDLIDFFEEQTGGGLVV